MLSHLPRLGRSLLLLLFLPAVACAPDLPLDPDEVERYFAFGVMDPNTGQVTGGEATLPADGFSTLELTAKLEEVSQKAGIQVSFSLIGAGTIQGDKDGDGLLKVPVSPAGYATLTLTSPTTVEAARVQATVESTPAVGEMTVRFTQPELDSILRFEEAPGAVPADGATETLYRLWVSPRIPEDRREVTLKVTGGAGVGEEAKASATIPVGPGAVVGFPLRSPSQSGSGLLSAGVAGFTRESPLEFATAYPTSIRVDAGAFSMAADAEATVVATLDRTPGTVSRGLVVLFSACEVREAGPCGGPNPPVGSFRSQTRSDASGGASAKFTPAGFKGPVRIEVGVEGSSVTGFALLESK